LRGAVLESEVDPQQAPESVDEYYVRQLVGLAVQDAAGRARGIVTGVLHLPAQDTLVVDVDGREVLVPFVAELVPEIDVSAGFVRVADVAGLLSPEESE
jgi:16S rRNA processing protein RimM